MKKGVIFLIAVLILTTAQQCSSGSSGKQNKVDPYIGGTAGLSPQFQQYNPPDEVIDNGQFPFNVEIKLVNSGEASVAGTDIKVKLTGQNPSLWGKTESDFVIDGIPQSIEPRYKDSEGNIIYPEDVSVFFQNLNYKEQLSVNYLAKFWAEVCYTYKTEAVGEGCIKSDILSTDPKDICQISEEKKIANSGAPIQVTRFLEQAGGTNKVRYTFTIEHKGPGRFFSPNSKCVTLRTEPKENRLRFRIDSAVADLVCSGFMGTAGPGKEGEILLTDGKRSITCTQTKESTLDYTDTIKITLTYDYEQSVPKEVLVKQSSR